LRGDIYRAIHLAQAKVQAAAIHLAAVHPAAVHQAVQEVAASGAVHQAVQLLVVHLVAAVDHWAAGVVVLEVVQHPLEAVPAASLLLAVPDSVVLVVPAALLPG
jgi:hypothetical protein